MAKITLPPISGNVRAGLINSNAQPNMGLAQGLAVAGEVVGQLAEKQEKLKTEKYNARATIANYDIKAADEILLDTYNAQRSMVDIDDLDPDNDNGLWSRLVSENEPIFNKSITSLNPQDREIAIAKRNSEMAVLKQTVSNDHAVRLNDIRNDRAEFDYERNVISNPEAAAAARADMEESNKQGAALRADELKQTAAYGYATEVARAAGTPEEIALAQSVYEEYEGLLAGGQAFNVRVQIKKQTDEHQLRVQTFKTLATGNAINKAEIVSEEVRNRMIEDGVATAEEIDEINKLATTKSESDKITSAGKIWMKSPISTATKKGIERIFSTIEPDSNPNVNRGKWAEINDYIDLKVDNLYARVEIKKYALQLLSLATGKEDYTPFSKHYGQKVEALGDGDVQDAEYLSYLNTGIERTVAMFDASGIDADISFFGTQMEERLAKLLLYNRDPTSDQLNTLYSEVITSAAAEAFFGDSSRPPKNIIDLLKKNPDKADDFDELYGEGASDIYLNL